MQYSPVAILSGRRGHRASSISQGGHTPGASGITPSSFSTSFIDHAFDHPTPTSFSQLQFMSSSVASNDGSDYTHRVPRVEEKFCSGFNCCGLELDDLHHLLEHFEERHVLANGNIGPDAALPANVVAAAAAAAAASAASRNTNRGSNSSTNNLNEEDGDADTEDAAGDMPQFDDFDDEEAERQAALAEATAAVMAASGNSSTAASSLAGTPASGNSPTATSATSVLAPSAGGSSAASLTAALFNNALAGPSNPTLSAPPSPALSSYSDHPGLFDINKSNKRKTGSSSLMSSHKKPTSRSPPSTLDTGNDDFGGGANDDASQRAHDALSAQYLPFTRRPRQQSVDSVASVSTNASTSSKKRSYGSAMGGNGNASKGTNSAVPSPIQPSRGRSTLPTNMLGNAGYPGVTMPTVDLAQLRNNTAVGSNTPITGGVFASAAQQGPLGFPNPASSLILTPDSSLPGTPASELDGLTYSLLHNSNSNMQNVTLSSTAGNNRLNQSTNNYTGGSSTTSLLGSGQGCLPPSLLFPISRSAQNTDDEDDEFMTATDEDEDDDDAGSLSYESYDDVLGNHHHARHHSSSTFGEEEDDENSAMGDDDGDVDYDSQMSAVLPGYPSFPRNSATHPSGLGFSSGQANMQVEGAPLQKRKKINGGSGSSRLNPAYKKSSSRRHQGGQYDSSMDAAAAAMFSPLSLLGGAHSPLQQSQKKFASNNPSPAGLPVNAAATAASQATLAAIQAAAAANAFPAGSTPTGRVWIPNNAKPFKCPVPGCDKAYKQQNGLKYHRLHGHCNMNTVGKEGEEIVVDEKDDDKPFGCYVGPACGKKYKNMNGLRYHYQHSGAHGQIGLQMLANGTHPAPAYPPGHKRTASKHQFSEHSSANSSTVVMNQATAEALLNAISTTSVASNSASNTPASSQPGSRSNSRPATPRIGSVANSRNASPNPKARRSPNFSRKSSYSSDRDAGSLGAFDSMYSQEGPITPQLV